MLEEGSVQEEEDSQYELDSAILHTESENTQ